MTFEYFCEVFERFMNFNSEKIRKMVHSIYDYNDDRFICELDVYTFIKTYEEDNSDLFMDVYVNDVIKIIAAIQLKK